METPPQAAALPNIETCGTDIKEQDSQRPGRQLSRPHRRARQPTTWLSALSNYMGTLFYGVHPTKRINKGTRPTSSIPNFAGVKEVGPHQASSSCRAETRHRHPAPTRSHHLGCPSNSPLQHESSQQQQWQARSQFQQGQLPVAKTLPIKIDASRQPANPPKPHNNQAAAPHRGGLILIPKGGGAPDQADIATSAKPQRNRGNKASRGVINSSSGQQALTSAQVKPYATTTPSYLCHLQTTRAISNQKGHPTRFGSQMDNKAHFDLQTACVICNQNGHPIGLRPSLSGHPTGFCPQKVHRAHFVSSQKSRSPHSKRKGDLSSRALTAKDSRSHLRHLGNLSTGKANTQTRCETSDPRANRSVLGPHGVPMTAAYLSLQNSSLLLRWRSRQHAIWSQRAPTKGASTASIVEFKASDSL